MPDDLRSFVFLGAPHTSNHDFVPAMACLYYIKRNSRYIIKDDWMKFPFNLFFKWTGAIGINRKDIAEGKIKSTTDIMANLFKKYEELSLVVAAEGTRKKREQWKTGFYYIAEKADVPIVLAYGDFEKKKTGVGKIIYLKDFESDMKEIMGFYQKIKGKNPENFSIDLRFIP